ncbi:hypothetical protein PINS_up011000 [Pythium insidiosum]|nr:hypothetical protein PINS_up011000 [Pythium insidiosum]
MAPAGPSSGDAGLHVRLSARTIRRLWLLLLSVQCVNTIVLLGRAYIYLAYGLVPISFLRVVVTVFLTKDQQQFIHRNYGVIGGSFLVLALLFIASIVATTKASRRPHAIQIAPCSQSIAPAPLKTGSFARMQRTASRVHARALSLWVSLGVRGERFEYGVVAREALEMAMQSAQAYSASRLITNTTLVLVAAVLIAFSGLMHPLLARVYPHNEAMRRFASIVFEFILDFAWGTVLPLWMYLPYIVINRSLTIPRVLETWPVGEYERSRLEIQQVMLLSWPEIGLSVFPFISALISIRSLRRLLASAGRNTLRTKDGEFAAVAAAATAVTPSHSLSRTTLTEEDALIAIRSALPSRTVRIGHHFLTVYGLVVLAVAIAAMTIARGRQASTGSQLSSGSLGCIYPLAPWLVANVACVGVVVNCSKLGISGRATELVKRFESVHASTVAYLALTDCPELEIPPSIERLSRLVSLVVVRSKIISWPNTAAIPSEHFSNLVSVVIGHVEFPERPQGFVARSWPATMERLIVVQSDVADAVKQVTTQWRHLRAWLCVDCGVASLPAALHFMPSLRVLAISSSSMQSIRIDEAAPPDWSALETLSLESNPRLTTVDDSVWNTVLHSNTLHVFSLAVTNVSAIPMTRIVEAHGTPVVVRGRGTPFCVKTSLLSEFSSQRLDCTTEPTDLLQYISTITDDG